MEVRVRMLDDLMAGDRLFDQPAVREAVLAAFTSPVLGDALLEAARDPVSGSLTAVGLARALAGHWLRPLLLDGVEASLRVRARDLKAAAEHGHASFHYNVAILGAGSNGAVAAFNLHQANPSLRIALIEDKDAPGWTFRNLGVFTWINSPEAPAFSTNEFTGVPFRARDFLEPGTLAGGPYFILPEVLADLTELAAAGSGADCWMGVQVTRVRPSAHQSFELDTSIPNLSLTADRVVAASGLGQMAPARDPGEPAPALDSFDDLAGRATAMIQHDRLLPPARRKSFMAPYAHRALAIIGAGDSANNLAEIASGFGPPDVYGREAERAQPGPAYGPGIGDPGGPASVLWVGQKFADAAAFTAGSKARYHKTLPKVFERFDRTRERLVGSRRTADGRAELDLQDPETGSRRRVTVDFAWDATGYAAASPMLRALWADAARGMGTPAQLQAWLSSREPVRGTVSVTAPGPHHGQVIETAVGRRIADSGPFREVYLCGAMASPLATPLELRDYSVTRNAHSLNVNLPRSASLGAILAGLHDYRPAIAASLPPSGPEEPLEAEAGNRVTANLRLPPSRLMAPETLTLGMPEEPARRGPYAGIAMAALLARQLAGRELDRAFTLRLEALPGGGAVRVTAEGLAETSAGALLADLELRRRDFLALGRDLLRGARAVVVTVKPAPALDASRIRVETMS